MLTKTPHTRHHRLLQPLMPVDFLTVILKNRKRRIQHDLEEEVSSEANSYVCEMRKNTQILNNVRASGFYSFGYKSLATNYGSL